MLLLDGAALLLFGATYLRRWEVGAWVSPYRRAMERIAGQPGWLLRGAGAAEAGLGLVMLSRSPVEVRPLYRIFSRVYDAVAFVWRDWLYPDAQRALEDAFATYLLSNGRILDLGCGTGANLERLLALGLPFASYTGVDLSEDMLQRARAKFDSAAQADFQQLNLMADPLPAGPYDLIISTWVFEHLPDPGRVVEKAWQRLHPGGHMILFFEVESSSWRSRLVRRIWHWFSARLLEQDEVSRLPGLLSLKRFEGAAAPVALAVLRKPEE